MWIYFLWKSLYTPTYTYCNNFTVSKDEGIDLKAQADSLTNFVVPGTTMEIKPQAFPTLTGTE